VSGIVPVRREVAFTAELADALSGWKAPMLLVSLIFLSAFHVLLVDDGPGARGSGIPDSVSGIHLVSTKHNIGIGRVPPQSTLFLGYAWHLHNGGFFDLIEVSAPL